MQRGDWACKVSQVGPGRAKQQAKLDSNIMINATCHQTGAGHTQPVCTIKLVDLGGLTQWIQIDLVALHG